MCVAIQRVCPGCHRLADPGDNDLCSQAPHCNVTATHQIPLRREHLDFWDCPTSQCPFNSDYVYELELEYLQARLAQREGNIEILGPSLTIDGKPVHVLEPMITGSILMFLQSV